MDSKLNRNIFQIRTDLQKKLMSVVFFLAILPAAVIGGSCYAVLSMLISCPKSTAGDEILLFLNMDNWMLIILATVPLAIIFVWFSALVVTNKIVGPIQRITSEIKARLDGTKDGPIMLRPGDQLKELMEQINTLLEKKK